MISSEFDDFEVILTVRSKKHNCHASHVVNEFDLDHHTAYELVRFVTYRLEDFIDEKNRNDSEKEETH